MGYCPLMSFYGHWFQEKTREARELNQLNLNTRDNVIVQIGFVF